MLTLGFDYFVKLMPYLMQ